MRRAKHTDKGYSNVVFKCWDCEIELCVPPNQVDRVNRGDERCNNPRCPGQKKGGGRYHRK